jgi:hypothetical protein
VQSKHLNVYLLRKLTIQVDGTTYGEGHGNSIKEAEADAAKQALIHFNVSFVLKLIASPIEVSFIALCTQLPAL